MQVSSVALERSLLDELLVWQEAFLVGQQTDSEEIPKLLGSFSRDQTLVEQVTDLPDGDFETISQQFQKVTLITLILCSKLISLAKTLGLYEKGSQRHDELQDGLQCLLTSRGYATTSSELTSGEVRRVGSFPVDGNSRFDIWEGLLYGTKKVALKVLRGINVDPCTKRVSLNSDRYVNYH